MRRIKKLNPGEHHFPAVQRRLAAIGKNIAADLCILRNFIIGMNLRIRRHNRAPSNTAVFPDHGKLTHRGAVFNPAIRADNPKPNRSIFPHGHAVHQNRIFNPRASANPATAADYRIRSDNGAGNLRIFSHHAGLIKKRVFSFGGRRFRPERRLYFPGRIVDIRLQIGAAVADIAPITVHQFAGYNQKSAG